MKDEQEKCAKMRKSIAEESGYYDGRKCFRKISIGKWFDNDSIISITRWERSEVKTLKLGEYGNQKNSFHLYQGHPYTLTIQREYTRTQCVGGAKEVKIERVLLIITYDTNSNHWK